MMMQLMFDFELHDETTESVNCGCDSAHDDCIPTCG